ncbi:MAG: peptidylprolyl isomerase [Bdellovibrionales bacterium]
MRLSHLLFSVVIGHGAWSAAEKIDGVVVVVNNEVILDSDYSRLDEKLLKPALIEDILLAGKSVDELKKSREAKTDYLVSERILDSEVKRLTLTATPERVDQEIKQMAQRYKTTTDEILKGVKAEMGFTTEEYRRFLKTQIERQSLIEAEISAKVRVSDEEVYAEYRRRNPNHRPVMSEVTLSHIFLNPKKGGAEAARQRAARALVRLKNGEKFEIVAEQASEDPNFNGGGLLGTFKSGELIPEFEQAIASLKVGGVSEVVSSKRGFHILKLLDQKATKDSDFEKEKEKMRSLLMERQFEKQFSMWLKRKKEEASITYHQKK